nr:hypothetical protein LTR18_001540 [Exophiala xenobiotica]
MATDGVGQFNLYMEKASSYHENSLWQEKLRALLAAQECIVEGFPEAEKRRQRVLTEIGGVRRRFGQYDEGIKTLNLALDADSGASPVTRARILGEMGVMYRHKNDFGKALQTFNEQFRLASEMGTLEGEIEMCRAVGNAGMSAYNLSQQQVPQDEDLLQTAIRQLQERIDRAQMLRDRLVRENPGSRYVAVSLSWKIIGMDRLSLCYVAAERTAEAVRLAEVSQRLQIDIEPTVRAFSRFFYGNALWGNGQHAEAIQQWSAEPGTCGSATALCKEPSAEHADYLQRLANYGLDFSSYDEQGFSPLDYAVLSDNKDAKAMVDIAIGALRTQLLNATPKLTDDQIDEEISRHLAQANLRRHYRSILQEHIRPVLRDAQSGTVRTVRRIYAEIMANDPTKKSILDDFYFVPYNDFKALGKLPVLAELRPGSREKLAKKISESCESDPNGDDLFIIFFSYRWIGRYSDPPVDGPDDSKHSQYHRMVNAVETLLQRKRLERKRIDPDQVGIWLTALAALRANLPDFQDCSCISQTDKVARERGVNALPMAVTQCDAMISLMDDDYWHRAWCAVEVRLMRELMQSYHLHEWWEHKLHSKSDPVHGALGRGNEARDFDISKMSLTEEKIDRPKIDFLVRQRDQDNSLLTVVLLNTLKGVVLASDACESSAEAASRHVSSLKLSSSDIETNSFDNWLHAITGHSGHGNDDALHITKLTAAVAYMRHKCQHAAPKDSLGAEELKNIWDIIRAALLSPLYAEKRAVRSHQGFLSVPLCDIRKPNGDNEELWRLHLWLPNRPQADPGYIVHSHKSFAQSWILAGEGTNGEYDVEPVEDIAEATHAIFALTDHRTITHRQLSTTIVNTGKFMKTKNLHFEPHTRDMSYVVPAAAFHTSQVQLSKVHATIFFFDASRGYSNDGGVSLGPKEVPKVEQNRNPGGFMANLLASVIDAVRTWETSLEEGLSFARAGKWPQAREVFEKMAMTWKPLPDAAPGAEVSSSSNDIQSLNHYLEMAQTLGFWAHNVVQGRARLAKADTTSAQKHFDIARAKCKSMSDATVAKKCEDILAACH